jgi:hypothetical protein
LGLYDVVILCVVAYKHDVFYICFLHYSILPLQYAALSMVLAESTGYCIDFLPTADPLRVINTYDGDSFYEKSVSASKSTRHYKPTDQHRQIYCSENLQLHMLFGSSVCMTLLGTLLGMNPV